MRRTCKLNLVPDKHMNVLYNIQTHNTASSARNPFTYSANMLVVALLHSGRWRRPPCSTLILRFSRGLGYKTPGENCKSSNNRPPPPPNQCFSIFRAFLFFAETPRYQPLHCFPSTPRMSCSMARIPLRVVEKFWCSCQIEGFEWSIFIFLGGGDREFAKPRKARDDCTVFRECWVTACRTADDINCCPIQFCNVENLCVASYFKIAVVNFGTSNVFSK